MGGSDGRFRLFAAAAPMGGSDGGFRLRAGPMGYPAAARAAFYPSAPFYPPLKAPVLSATPLMPAGARMPVPMHATGHAPSPGPLALAAAAASHGVMIEELE